MKNKYIPRDIISNRIAHLSNFGIERNQKVLVQRSNVVHFASAACKKGDASELSIILEFDPKATNETCNCKKTPLHTACQGGFNDCIELLIDGNADVNATTVDGETALHFAARSGFASTCELLVRSGAALESGAAKNQATPLLLAVEAGHAGAASVLLQLGANFKATSAGFAFGIERIATSAECGEVLSNWKSRDT